MKVLKNPKISLAIFALLCSCSSVPFKGKYRVEWPSDSSGTINIYSTRNGKKDGRFIVINRRFNMLKVGRYKNGNVHGKVYLKDTLGNVLTTIRYKNGEKMDANLKNLSYW